VKALISTLATGALAISALALTAGQASAAGPPACHAPSGRACVAVSAWVHSRAHSVRVNGQCLYWNSVAAWHYYPNVMVGSNGTPSVRVYSGSNCQSNTAFGDSTRWTTEGGDSYRYLNI
jgi:hypothetical protein